MKINKIKLFVSILTFAIIVSGAFIFTGCSKKKMDNNVENGSNNNNNVTSNSDKYFSLSSTNITIPLGSTSTVDLLLTNAVGRVDVVSNNGNIASVDNSVLWLESIDEGVADTKTISIQGKETGNTQIIVNLSDVAAFDTESAVTGSYTINVTVQ